MPPAANRVLMAPFLRQGGFEENGCFYFRCRNDEIRAVPGLPGDDDGGSCQPGLAGWGSRDSGRHGGELVMACNPDYTTPKGLKIGRKVRVNLREGLHVFEKIPTLWEHLKHRIKSP